MLSQKPAYRCNWHHQLCKWEGPKPGAKFRNPSASPCSWIYLSGWLGPGLPEALALAGIEQPDTRERVLETWTLKGDSRTWTHPVVRTKRHSSRNGMDPMLRDWKREWAPFQVQGWMTPVSQELDQKMYPSVEATVDTYSRPDASLL